MIFPAPNLRRHGSRARGLVLVLLAAALLSPVHAQEDTAAAEGDTAAPVEVDPLSPRASLDEYLTLCRNGNFTGAAAFLPGVPAGTDPAEAARRLKVVLDRHIWFDLDEISPAAEGDRDDGLPAGRERLGTFETPSGTAAVEMIRRDAATPPGWVFAPETVTRVDDWYAVLGEHWLRDRLPPWLLRSGPLELQWWQWAALPVAVGLAWLLARLAMMLLRPVLLAWAHRSSTDVDDLLVEKLVGPARLFLMLLLFRSFVTQIDLVIPAHEFVARLVRGAFLGGVFWVLMRLVEVALLMAQRSTLLQTRQGLSALTPFIARALRTVIFALAAVTILQEFGFQVTGLLAGMGLAGMAVALAGQKSVENLIGSGTLLADQPFRPGDFVRIGDLVGTVENVGLRSSRIRTLDRTLVTLPNGALSETRLETFAARDRIRLLCVIGVTYATGVQKMRKLIAGLEEVLREHPRVCDDPRRVRFIEFGSSSLNLEVFAYLQTRDWAEFLELRQELYLSFMEVVEANGAVFAFPTQTVHVESFPAGARPQERGNAS